MPYPFDPTQKSLNLVTGPQMLELLNKYEFDILTIFQQNNITTYLSIWQVCMEQSRKKNLKNEETANFSKFRENLHTEFSIMLAYGINYSKAFKPLK